MQNSILSAACRKTLAFILLSLFLKPAFSCEALTGKFCVEYFKNIDLEGDPVVSRRTPEIKYNWRKGPPARRIPKQNFSARWRGRFKFSEGLYNFRVLADEGVRLKVDGQVLIDHWHDGPEQEFNIKHNPGAGKHIVEVEYFDSKGEAFLEVNWKLMPNNTASNENKASIGVNLAPFHYWSSSVPFKDLLKQSGLVGVYKKGTKNSCEAQINYDAAGYPQTLPEGCVFRIWSAFHIPGNKFWPIATPPYQPGHYVLTYQGQGKIRLSWDAKKIVDNGNGRIEFYVTEPKRGIQIEVVEIEPNSPIADMHIVHVSDEMSFKQQPFNEKWLNILKPFSVLRFKDWSKIDQKIIVFRGTAVNHTEYSVTLPISANKALESVNKDMVAKIKVNNQPVRVLIDRFDKTSRTLYLKSAIDLQTNGQQPSITLYDFANRKWLERAMPDSLTLTSNKGLSFEDMIQLANILDVDPWISIPTAADDDFVENLASLIKRQLKPNLKCYIEYSNETWNYNYPGYDYSEAKSRQLNLTATVIPADAWHPYRAVEIFRIFNRVFGEENLRKNRQNSRLVRVLTSQTAWLNRAKAVMDWQQAAKAWPTMGMPAYQYADAWAATTYFSIRDMNIMEQSMISELIEIQIDQINEMFGKTSNPGIIRKIHTEADKRGLQLLIYEAGNETVMSSRHSDLIAKAAKMNQDTGMYKVYRSVLEQWSQLYHQYGSKSVGVWTHYYDVGRYGKSGYWGLLQSTYQNPETAPKYQAILDYASQP